MTSSRSRQAAQAGFSFIEILVVMGIITVLVGAVVVVIPRVTEKSRQTTSINNVRNMIQMMISRQIEKDWPSYNGKNFVLSLVATGLIDHRNKENLNTFFSPGDKLYTLAKTDVARYSEINKKSLKTNDFKELTSYAGRRNADKEWLITPNQESKGTPIMSDDDEGPLHHPGGLIIGFSNGSTRLWEWEDLEMTPPNDPDNPEQFLGDSAQVDLLRPLSSTN